MSWFHSHSATLTNGLVSSHSAIASSTHRKQSTESHVVACLLLPVPVPAIRVPSVRPVRIVGLVVEAKRGQGPFSFSLPYSPFFSRCRQAAVPVWQPSTKRTVCVGEPLHLCVCLLNSLYIYILKLYFEWVCVWPPAGLSQPFIARFARCTSIGGAAGCASPQSRMPTAQL